MQMQKVLFLGEIGNGQTSRMRLRALERLGYSVRGVNTMEPWRRAQWLKRQTQRRLQRGTVVDEINSSAITAAQEFQPDIVWAEKQEFLRVETVEKLRKGGARLIHFTPDPYFSLDWKRTRLMDEALRAFDVLVYCKQYERPEYEKVGKTFVYMPLGYCDEVHRPLTSCDSRWNSAIGFLGGWEPRRHLILRQLAIGDNFQFHKDPLLAAAHQGGEVYADDYARALTGAKIGIGFLRKVCPDQHTTRTFEIPACGSMLLADRTEEHQSFFQEGQEAEFFSSAEELIDKARYYSRNEDARAAIAARGRQRCIDSRYAYVHRMRAAMAAIA
jgi:spore maturation protein CgeB